MIPFFIFVFSYFCLLFNNLLIADTLSISTNPSTLTISTATAGQQPTSAINSSTNYNMSTTAGKTKSITGSINSAMPSGVTLSVQLAAPSGATSSGSVAMTTTALSLVTSIPGFTSATGLTITYNLSATVSASHVTGGTRTLTLSLQ
jgi:hypothetical protein